MDACGTSACRSRTRTEPRPANGLSLTEHAPHFVLPPVCCGLLPWWLQGIDPELRRGFFDSSLSNASTLIATVGWLAATAMGASRSNRSAWAALGLGWALWILAAGAAAAGARRSDAGTPTLSATGAVQRAPLAALGRQQPCEV